MSTAPWAVSIEIPVAWGEQDLFGHVNNIVYFRYFESVRMHFLDRVGILRSHMESQQGVILASTTCDFLQPVVWPQRLRVNTRCSAIGNTSFTMAYAIIREDDTVVATGTSVQVMYDYRAGAKIRVPDSVRAAIGTLQSTIA
jgi:acyl-CoA thioester hydrolase